MKVWMTKELEELYFTGKSKVYKDVQSDCQIDMFIDYYLRSLKMALN